MSVYEEGTHDRLALINIKLGELDNNVNKYFDNYNIEQLAHVITTVNAKIESSGIENAKWDVDMTTLRSRVDLEKCSKQEYHELIEICNQLWIVNGLLIEATHQADFEHRVQSYLKLKKKVDTLKHNSDGINTSSLKIIHKLEDKVDELKNDLVSYMKNQFIKYLNIDDRDAQIVYVGNIDDVQFITFLKLCKQVITVSLNDFFKLTTNLNSWLEIIFEKLQQGNVDFFSFTATNDGVLKLQPEHGAADFLHFVKSIEEIISFSNQVIFETNEIDDFNNVRISTGKLILKKLKSKIFEKENVYPLIVDKLNYDESTNSEISSISALYKISNLLSQPGWSKDGICELEFWLDDLTTSWVDNLVNCTIDRLKEFVIKFTNEGFDARLKDSNLISVEIDVQQCNKEQVATNGNKAVDEDDGGWGNEWDNNEEWNDDVNSTNKDELTEAEEVEDDGGWGHEELDIDINSITDQVKKTEEEQIQPNEDDGGWSDDDLDLDIDSVNETKQREEEEEEDNDGWSAWDNEVKISANDISGSSETQHISEGNKFIIPTYKYSTLVNELINIFENYMKNYEDLLELHVNQEQNEQAKDLFKHGFKKLCISYFMMIEQEVNETYQNEILFYNDFNKLLEECYNKYDVDLTTCYRMNFNSLNQFMNQYTSQLISIIEDYDISIWNDNDFENDDKLAMYSKEFLIRYDTQLDKILLDLSELSKFNTQLITNILLTIIFKSFNILCDKILRRSDISSYESEILSGIIDHLTTHISQETHNLNIKVEKIQTLNKLQQIKLILSSNLKEILDLFYDAKLYELETQELTSLILSLFVESPQRSKTIEEIKTIRETKF